MQIIYVYFINIWESWQFSLIRPEIWIETFSCSLIEDIMLFLFTLINISEYFVLVEVWASLRACDVEIVSVKTVFLGFEINS